jgi:enoyl-CoA hydratase/carnithine racemase
VFSAGFDLSEFERAAGDDAFGRELWASSDRYHETVLKFPLPTLAAINGPALAGGFDLAILCDLRIASSTARFAHPERTFGDIVYGPLHDLVGGAVARELTIGGRELTADEALAVHLVGQVVPPEALAHAVTEAVTRITAVPRDVLRRTKAKALTRAGYPPSTNGIPTLDL